MPLLTGNWTITINGHEGQLSITSISADGRFGGTLTGGFLPSGSIGFPVSGFWNEAAQMIMMQVSDGGAVLGGTVTSASKTCFLTGYMFSIPPMPAPGGDVKWHLCGSVTIPPNSEFVFGNPNSHRMIFGWRAEIAQVI